jgi:hypothetical protein
MQKKDLGYNMLHTSHATQTSLVSQHNGYCMAFAVSFLSPYKKAQWAGLLGSIWPNHCSKFTCPLCKNWHVCCANPLRPFVQRMKTIVLWNVAVQSIVPVWLIVQKFWLTLLCLPKFHAGRFTGHNGLYLSYSIIHDAMTLNPKP